ncbi:MAG: TetR/AcrR family transcriptional regulator [Alphaproteobacteria bacterium]
MEKKAKAAPRGRPRDREKHQAIMVAAWAQFLENGVTATSIERVAAAAGVSKMTVYSHFGDKMGLFGEVIRSGIDSLGEALRDLPDPPSDLRRALVAYGCAFVRFLRRPDIMQLDRMLVPEAATQPKLAETFYRNGPQTVLDTVGGLLEAAAQRGEIDIDDPMKAADSLTASWCHGPDWMRQRLGLRDTPSDAEITERVERSVDWLLARHQRPPR